MKTLYEFKKSNVLLYEPWTQFPEPPLCSIMANSIEEAIKKAEKQTGLNFVKDQMAVSTPYLCVPYAKGLNPFMWKVYFSFYRKYIKLYHFYINNPPFRGMVR